MLSPAPPVHAVGVRGVVTVEVLTVQVGIVTGVVPPSAFEKHGTISSRIVVVLVLCGETHPVMQAGQ